MSDTWLLASSGNITAFSWESSALSVHSSSIAASVSGIVSAIAGLCVVMWYYRCRASAMRTPINDTMIFSLAFGALGSINAAVSGIVRLAAPAAMQQYCDISAILVQLFTIPAGIGISAYFISVVHEIHHGQNDYARSSKLIAFCVAFGVVSGAVMYSAVPYNPSWGTRMAPTNQPWCWMPTQQQNGSMMIGYFLGSIVLAQFWYLFALITGLLCLFYVRRRWRVLKGASAPLPLIFYARALYLLYYFAVWVCAELSNVFPEYNMSEALMAPSVPLIDGLIFVWSEYHASKLHPGATTDESLVDESSKSVAAGEYSTFSVNALVQQLVIDDSTRAIGVNANLRFDEETQEWLMDNQKLSDFPSEIALLLANVRTPDLSKKTLSWMLSFLAGYCDCCGFLSLELFTAHVTGNFCTIGMSLANHTSVALKGAGLAVFCTTVVLAKLLQNNSRYAGRFMMVIQCALLLLSWICSKALGYKEETLGAFLTGLSMVSGMAVQNVFQRTFLVGLPMTTLMTGNTTSLFIDLLTWSNADARQRVKNNALAAVSFLCGCAAVTCLKLFATEWMFFPPPLICMLALALTWRELDK